MRKKDCLNVNTNGNKKLVNNDFVRFLIWNLPAIKTCPYATEHCKNACYALAAENAYPTVKPCRENNYNESLKADFAKRMIETITYYRNSKSYKNKLMIVRIHESGDFYNQEYANKWVEIINHFKNDKTIIFHCYTKSLVFFHDVDIKNMSNLAFIASVWDDTSKEALKEISEKNYRIYTAVESFDNWKGNKCRCEDCAHCMQCMNNKCQNIACVIH